MKLQNNDFCDCICQVILLSFVPLEINLIYLLIYFLSLCMFYLTRDFDHNSIHYRSRHLSSRPRSSNSYYSTEQSGAIHHGNVKINEDKIIMTPVTPDQSMRGLDSSWSIVSGPGHQSGTIQTICEVFTHNS